MTNKRFLSLLLTVAMLLTASVSVLSAVVSAVESTVTEVNLSKPQAVVTQTDIMMNVGSDETERNFVWYCNSTEGSLELAMRNGDTFPTEYDTYRSSVAYSSSSETYIHRVSVFDLKPETEYVYRLKNGSTVSKNYYFKTAATDNFTFAFAGDPQLGAYGVNHITPDGNNWAKTVDFVKSDFPETTLFITAGDQVNNGNNEAQYDAFLNQTNVPTFAFATTVGNHETSYYNMDPYTGGPGIFKEHYNLPNTQTGGVVYNNTETASNYWYTYNNVLFMHLNTNNLTYAEHKAFMEAAIAANPNVTWKIVVMHYSFYGAWYFNKEAIIVRREGLAAILDELDIDVVLNGHEHVYARSYMIENGTDAQITTPSQSSVTDPKGILYITASSSSSSKFYNLLDDSEIPHVAVKYKNKQTISMVDVGNDSFKIVTYDVSNKSVLDTFEIVKTNTKPMPSTTNIASGKSYDTTDLYTSNGTIKYPDETGKTMTDGKTAPSDALYKDAAFLAFHSNTTSYGQLGYSAITVDFGKSYGFSRFVARVGTTACTSGVTAPTKLDIYVSDNKSSWTYAGSTSISDTSEVSCIAATVVLENKVSARYVQYRFTHKNFCMVAEVEAYEWHDHTLSAWEVFSEATLYDNGLKVKHCTSCGETAERVFTPSFSTDPDNKNRALGRKYSTTAPNRGDGDKYNDDGIRLTDGEKGNIDGGGVGLSGNKAYSGWNTTTDASSVEILIDLETPWYTDTYTIYLAGGNWGIEHPTEYMSLDVYASNNIERGYTLVASAPAGSAVLTNGDGVAEDAWSTYTLTATAKYARMSRYIKLVINNCYEGKDSVWMDEFEILMLNEIVEDPNHEHIAGDWEITVEPKVGVEGEKQLRCSSCGAVSETQVIPALVADEGNLAAGKTYTTSQLHGSNGGSYPDEGGITMTDGKLAPADAIYSHNAFIGFNTGTDYANKYFTITVDLGQTYDLGKFVTYVASVKCGAGITAPTSVEVCVSDDNATWVSAGETLVTDDDTVSCLAVTLKLKQAVSGRYIQYRYKPSSNWVMVAEVEAYKFTGSTAYDRGSDVLELNGYESPTDNRFTPGWAPWNENPELTYDDGVRLKDGVYDVMGWTDAAAGWSFDADSKNDFILNLKYTSKVDKIVGHFMKYAGYASVDSFVVSYSTDGKNYTAIDSEAIYLETVAVGAKDDAMSGYRYTVLFENPVEANFIKVTVGNTAKTIVLVEELAAYGTHEGVLAPVVSEGNGDVNDDGKVDSVDYLLLKRYCFNSYTLSLEEKTRGDLNKDGIINSVDYVLVRRIAFGTYEI